MPLRPSPGDEHSDHSTLLGEYGYEAYSRESNGSRSGHLVWNSLGATRAQNTNQVLGQVDFDAKTNIDKGSGVWVDGQYLGYVGELKGNKKVLLIPGKHEIAVRQVGFRDITQSIEVSPGRHDDRHRANGEGSQRRQCECDGRSEAESNPGPGCGIR